jgi:hypothetical protein
MDEMEIDVEEIRLAGRPMHDVAFPDLLGKGLRFVKGLGPCERLSRGHVRSAPEDLFHYVDVCTIIWT